MVKSRIGGNETDPGIASTEKRVPVNVTRVCSDVVESSEKVDPACWKSCR